VDPGSDDAVRNLLAGNGVEVVASHRLPRP
jgi:hypothetical protein